ncbi:MAG: cytochrome c biogenesis CcdA family protein [Solirubrobacterales bacterium]
MGGEVDTTVLAAFGVGLLSFFSPCVLPLVPGYLAAISGVAVGDVEDAGPRRMLAPALIFVAAFTVIFMLGGMVATGLGQLMTDNTDLLRKISGAAIIGLGVFLAATLFVPRLNVEMRSQELARRAGVGGPLIAGAAFAIAWTPCVGPTLGAILAAAGTQQNLWQGAVLLFFYSAGLAVPFIASALGIGAMADTSGWIKRHYPLMIGVSSAVLIVVGILILTNEFFRLNAWASDLTGSLNLDF